MTARETITPNEAAYTEELYTIPPPVVVVVPVQWAELAESEKSLLGKILAAAKLSLQRVRVVSATTIDAVDFTAASNVISFGTTFRTPQAQYETIETNGSLFIFSDPLSLLDDARKKSLWIAMKKMFGL